MELAKDLTDRIGQELGVTEWMEMTQERVNDFADATDDHQWIHVDPDRAAKGPFGGPIAHGFLTLSLTVTLMSQIPFDVGEYGMAINYGLNKVRFPSPVPVGSRIRARVSLDSAEEVPDGIQVTRIVTIEVEGSPKPAMVAEAVSRYY
jgi:acyl dehydratase